MEAQEQKPAVEAQEPKPGAEAAPEPTSASGVFFQFVVFPLVIVVIAVVISGFFTWIAQDRRTYADYLNEIASGWKQKRPEAAYQIQFRLADSQDELRKTADVPGTISVFV